MKRSTDRIFVTHVGSLVRPTSIRDILSARDHGQPYEEAAYEKTLREEVAGVVRKQAGTARVWAVLKADAYGHGAPAVARTLERDRRVDGFCVALLEEGVELREAGIAAPILVMGGHFGNAHEEIIAREGPETIAASRSYSAW